jgi:hypothetical protein
MAMTVTKTTLEFGANTESMLLHIADSTGLGGTFNLEHVLGFVPTWIQIQKTADVSGMNRVQDVMVRTIWNGATSEYQQGPTVNGHRTLVCEVSQSACPWPFGIYQPVPTTLDIRVHLGHTHSTPL